MIADLLEGIGKIPQCETNRGYYVTVWLNTNTSSRTIIIFSKPPNLPVLYPFVFPKAGDQATRILIIGALAGFVFPMAAIPIRLFLWIFPIIPF
jgi:hypothetical protein